MAQHLRIHWQIYHSSCSSSARRVNVALDLLKFLHFFSLVFLPFNCRQLFTRTKIPPSCSIHIVLVDALNQSYLDPVARASRFVYMDSLSCEHLYIRVKRNTLVNRVHVWVIHAHACMRMSKWYGFVCIFLHNIVIFIFFLTLLYNDSCWYQKT